MHTSDEEYFVSLEKTFDIFPLLFTSDVLICLTDREKYVKILEAESFKLSITEGMPILKGGDSEQAMVTKKRQSVFYSKETFGMPVMAYAVPIINNETGNVLGTITYAVSQEKENDVLEMAEELKAFSEQLMSSAQELAGSAEELSSSSRNMGSIMNDTKEGIAKMDDILQYIREVADTTNLLGLNAAIEAARAGEYGRGFSVVASEIRKLSNTSKSSANEITAALTKVKNDINSILEFLNTFAGTSENQAAQAEQLSANSEKLTGLSSSLLSLAQNLNS
jgi:uncharacterized membrane protein YdfJ with MMPL/SSD domain